MQRNREAVEVSTTVMMFRGGKKGSFAPPRPGEQVEVGKPASGQMTGVVGEVAKARKTSKGNIVYAYRVVPLRFTKSGK